jgi:hypothetical protein
MDGIFGCGWADVMIIISTFCIIDLSSGGRPVSHSEVEGYPTGED